MRLLVATTNPHKLREIRQVLHGVEPASLAALPPVAEPEETGQTFEENARLKALFYDRHARHSGGAETREGWLTVAEDSGLEIDALDGAPGIYSARFVAPTASYPERFAEIYRLLSARQAARPWTARFVCALAVAAGGRVIFETRGTIEGEIASTPSGHAGFGYDPVFRYPPLGRTLAEVTTDEKLAVAHRGVAFRALDRWLSEAYPY